jgi:hypothetical protein
MTTRFHKTIAEYQTFPAFTIAERLLMRHMARIVNIFATSTASDGPVSSEMVRTTGLSSEAPSENPKIVVAKSKP